MLGLEEYSLRNAVKQRRLSLEAGSVDTCAKRYVTEEREPRDPAFCSLPPVFLEGGVAVPL